MAHCKQQSLPSADEIALKPWKYIGWRGFAEFAASDDDFLILRRFDTSSVRVLLSMQDHIAKQEELLSKIDLETSDINAPDINNGTLRDEPRQDRAALIEDLKSSLLEYKKFVWLHSELKSRPPADTRSRRNVDTWLYNYKGALAESELGFTSADDLIKIVPRQRPPLRRFLEYIKVFHLKSIFKSKTSDRVGAINVTIFSDLRIDFVVRMLQLFIGVGMLIGPLWILNSVKDTRARLAAISGFVVAFLALISVLTASRISEALAATAAYSAVLMVFMQIQA